MTKLDIIKNSFGKTGLRLKKHAPEILVTTGVIGVVTSTVMACKATTKLDTILAEKDANVEKINNYVEENGFSEKYTEEDSKKDMVIVYAQTAVKVAKLYAPSVIVGTLSLAAIISAHKMLRTRNIALATTVTALTTQFKDYRGRVIDRFGADLDRELRYNVVAKEIEETIVDENGEEKTVKKTIETIGDDPTKYSVYARFFDDGCIGWEKNSEFNLMFLKRQQDYANEVLKARGYYFLNEVYAQLGIPQTKIGQQVGWVYDEKNPIGDNYIDFGIYDTNKESVRNFVNGYEKTILLDFNVDGDILDHLA